MRAHLTIALFVACSCAPAPPPNQPPPPDPVTDGSVGWHGAEWVDGGTALSVEPPAWLGSDSGPPPKETGTATDAVPEVAFTPPAPKLRRITRDSPEKPSTPHTWAAPFDWAAYLARECYAKRLLSAPGEKGNLWMWAIRTDTGFVRDFKVFDRTVSDALVECVTSSIKAKVQFDPPQVVGLPVRLGFSFEPK